MGHLFGTPFSFSFFLFLRFRSFFSKHTQHTQNVMCVFLSPLFSSIFLLIGFGDALLLNPPPENYSNFWEKGVTKSSHEKYKKTLNEFLQWLERGHGFVRNPETQMTSKFAFFKTPKTGSSSLHQIFSSFGIRRGFEIHSIKFSAVVVA